jgi:hypothetical protein
MFFSFRPLGLNLSVENASNRPTSRGAKNLSPAFSISSLFSIFTWNKQIHQRPARRESVSHGAKMDTSYDFTLAGKTFIKLCISPRLALL